MHYLLVRFLTSAFSLKLEDLADEWFVSRGTLQNDMAEVRERLAHYQLTIETKPRYGMKLFGAEMAIRACLTDLLFQLQLADAENPLLNNEILLQPQVAAFAGLLHPLLSQYAIRLTDEGEQYLIFYCVVALRRINDGYPLPDFEVEDGDDAVRRCRPPGGGAAFGLRQRDLDGRRGLFAGQHCRAARAGRAADRDQRRR